MAPLLLAAQAIRPGIFWGARFKIRCVAWPGRLASPSETKEDQAANLIMIKRREAGRRMVPGASPPVFRHVDPNRLVRLNHLSSNADRRFT